MLNGLRKENVPLLTPVLLLRAIESSPHVAIVVVVIGATVVVGGTAVVVGAIVVVGATGATVVVGARVVPDTV
jgi:hypothetical protein